MSLHDGESVWRHAKQLKEDECGLAEWVFLDRLLLVYHEHGIGPDEEGGYQEYSSNAEQSMWDDKEFNRA